MYKNIVKLALSVTFCILVIGYTLSRIQLSQAEDMGIFLSVAGFLASGASLYSGVFEIKDPLFLYSGFAALEIFGRKGPYLIDVLFILGATYCAFKISMGYMNSVVWRYFITAIFLLAITGAYYQSYRSGLAAIFFYMVCWLSFSRKLNVVAGIFSALVLFSKMPYIIFVAPFALCCIKSSEWRRLISCILGWALGSSAILIVLYLRGEIVPYFNMVVENFRYRDIYAELSGMRGGVMGHVDAVNRSGSSVFLLVATVVLLMCGMSPRDKKKDYMLPILIAASVIVFLVFSAMWPHHLHVLVIYLFATSIVIAGYASSDSKPERKDRLKKMIAVLSIIYVGTICGVSINIDTHFPVFKSENYSLKKPIEVSYLESISSQKSVDRSIARLGANDDSGFGAFLTKDWKLVCPRFWQAGQESEETANETLSCLSSKPNYVLVSRSFFDLNRPFGSYGKFKERSLELLDNKFECHYVNNDEHVRICVRNN